MSEGVSQLLQAEAEANKIIQQAYEDRQNQLKKARIEAEQDIEKFKKEEEARFQAEIQKRFGSSQEEQELKKKTEEEIVQINKAYDLRKNEVIELLIERVMNVDLEIPNVVKRALTNKN